MDLITSDEVILRISTYYEGGVLAYRHAARRSQIVSPRPTRKFAAPDSDLTPQNAEAEAVKFLAEIPSRPEGLSGRGIVICGGGQRYFPCAWICIQMLRGLGCALPIEL
jgi:hypothetical protein